MPMPTRAALNDTSMPLMPLRSPLLPPLQTACINIPPHWLNCRCSASRLPFRYCCSVALDCRSHRVACCRTRLLPLVLWFVIPEGNPASVFALAAAVVPDSLVVIPEGQPAFALALALSSLPHDTTSTPPAHASHPTTPPPPVCARLKVATQTLPAPALPQAPEHTPEP